MADQQMRPASPEQAPDPSFNYERSHPERESVAGTLGSKAVDKATPTPSSDGLAGSVTNAQDPQRSLAAQDANPPQPTTHGLAAPADPDHSLVDEEPVGWDQAPRSH